MADFASRISKRIQENPAFQKDYAWLCSSGIAALTGSKDIHLETLQIEESHIRLARLIESASCFAMHKDSHSHQLAQTIALYGVASNDNQGFIAACGHILAELGNFPASDFVRENHKGGDALLPSVIHMRDFARKYHNTVNLPSGRVSLTDFQLDIWGDISQGISTAVSAPTSAGKSFVIREYIVQQIKEREAVNVAYIVPTRALMAEVQDKLVASLGEDTSNLRITSVPVEDVEQRSRQVFVVTQERLISYLDEVPSACFDYVVVDEAQQMGDGSRGMILQECLERINKVNPNCVQYFIAPMASRVDNLAAAVGQFEVASHLTQQSPVVSTKIVVKPNPDSVTELTLEILERSQRIPVGLLRRAHGFGDRQTLLASVCLELGAIGGSLVYASGQANAEEIAMQIAVNLPETENPELIELARFIRNDVHKDYSLAFCVLRGVGFHYGSMPTLLRQTLEDAFRNGSLAYLACTTTLFQGVNLPARHVFIDKVKRGSKDQLDQDDIWNFVGRAGRLKQDLAGNVFLVDYDNWPAKLLDTPPQVKVEPALSKILNSDLMRLEQYIDKKGQIDEKPEKLRDIEAAAGLMLNRMKRGTFQETITRCGPQLSNAEVSSLERHLKGALEQLATLPVEVLERNWLIAPWRLQSMYEFLEVQVRDGIWLKYYPQHPMHSSSYERYLNMFNAIEELLKGKANEKWAKYLNYQALKWMKGATISQLVEGELKYRPIKRILKSGSVSNSNPAVRRIFDLLEKTLRFTYVQLTRAYCDCLAAALRKSGLHKEADGIYPVALALELGACTKTIISLIELGVSRISAQTLSRLILGSELTAPQIKDWLRTRSTNDLPVSQVILEELKRLRLLKAF